MEIMVSESRGVSIEFECKFGVKIKECSFNRFYNENSSRLRRVCYEPGREAFLL
jgi:hypothetical protein